jgi:thiamine-phosphate pyrophosphorylase
MAADKLARAQLARAAWRFKTRGLPALVLMTDDSRLPDPLAAARALPRGSMVILRARRDADRARLAAALIAIARARKLVLLIANDGPLATKIGAHGLHLSEDRACDAAHWRMRHPDWLITVAAHSLAACMRARYADAAILAPVFATASHPDSASLGAIQARIIANASPLKIYALGGIDARTARQLSNAWLAGLAAISALS